MKVSVDDISKTEKKIQVVIPKEEVQEKRNSIFQQFKTSARIKGFRQGKAPNHVVESMYGNDIKEEVISKLVSETFESAIQESSLTPINRPDIQPGDYSRDNDFSYSAVFEILPEFELASYEGINLKKEVYKVKDEDVENTIKKIRENNAQSKLLEEERPVQKGDYVYVDYSGTLEDGSTIDDLNRENVKFVVGEDQLLPEFEENILGKKAGEESSFEVEYPEDFSVKEAAGKKVNFKLKINEIHERILPEVNDDFAKDVGFENVSDLKSKIREDIESRQEQQSLVSLKEQIVNELEKRNEIDLPRSLVENEKQRLVKQFAADLQSRGVEMPEMNEDMSKKFDEKAVSSVKSSLVLNRISMEEKIEATDEEINERIQQIADSYQVPFETVHETYRQNNMLENFESQIVEKKVIDLIIEKANVEEVEAGEDKIDNENES